ncbi:MAG: monovalent cation/H+ antiporter subunit D family protein [Cellvibrionaceae bacterium]
MFSQHFPVLAIVLPLMAAPLCVIVRQSFGAWLIAVLVSLCSFVLTTLLLLQVLDGDVIRYQLGGWMAPTGIEYYIDSLNAALLMIISLISTLTLVYAKPTVEKEVAKPRHYLFYAGWLMCLTGLLGIVITGDAFNVFVFLEISSLSMYMLIALGKERRQALLAAFRYLIMGSIGASFILLGIGFLYAATGTLNMADLAVRLENINDSRTVIVGFSFITVGLLIKAAVFPVYSWLPNAYQYAPTAVTAFLAGTATKVSLYVFLRFFFHIFGADYSFADMLLGKVLLPLAVVGFFVMSVVAIFQTDIRRLLAYSSIAQLGYMFTAVSMATHAGLTAGIIHIVNHAFIKTALFIAVGCIAYRIGSTRISDMNNLLRSMPWTVSAFIIAGLSLIGIPLTAGFISKWHLVSAAIESGWWPIAIMILLSSLMAIIYIGKIIEAFCFKPENSVKASGGDSEATLIKEAPLMMLLPLWTLIVISVYTGINGDIVVNFAELAAQQLLGGMQ